MIKLKHLITEHADEEYDIDLLAETVNSEYRTNYAIFLSTYTWLLCRGSRHLDAEVVIKKSRTRSKFSVSANKIHNVLLNYLPSWKKIPNRNKSSFFSMRQGIAGMFGDQLRLVVPSDTCLLAGINDDFIIEYAQAKNLLNKICYANNIDPADSNINELKEGIEKLIVMFKRTKSTPESWKFNSKETKFIPIMDKEFDVSKVLLTHDLKQFTSNTNIKGEVWTESDYLSIKDRNSVIELNYKLLKIDKPYWEPLVDRF